MYKPKYLWLLSQLVYTEPTQSPWSERLAVKAKAGSQHRRNLEVHYSVSYLTGTLYQITPVYNHKWLNIIKSCQLCRITDFCGLLASKAYFGACIRNLRTNITTNKSDLFKLLNILWRLTYLVQQLLKTLPSHMNHSWKITWLSFFSFYSREAYWGERRGRKVKKSAYPFPSYLLISFPSTLKTIVTDQGCMHFEITDSQTLVFSVGTAEKANLRLL